MFGERIKQYRLAKGMSLDELVAATGGIVSKVALSKYERNIIKPSVKVLHSLAKALNVKTIFLSVAPQINVEFIAYRKGSGLGKKQQLIVENLVATKLEDTVKVQNLLYTSSKPNLPIKHYNIQSFDDVETAAVDLRKKWKLGLDPISNLTHVLESNFVHVILINTVKKFDGISALAYFNKKQLKAAAVVSRKNIAGDRQRLNLAHELGHIVLNVSSKLDEEKTAFRFGGALLAPAESIFNIVGQKRNHFQLRELIMYKRFFGISIQALLYRLRNLEIISQSLLTKWYQIINRNNWKKSEPAQMKEEKPVWFERNVLHAFSEGLISTDETSRLLGQEIDSKGLSLIQKKEFLKASVKDRAKILRDQADKLLSVYSSDESWQELSHGDFIEY